MKIQLTKRDLNLFHQLDSFGLLSTAQINSLVFPNVNYRTVLRRLRKLEKVKHLIRTRFYKGGVTSWHLTKKSASLLGTTPLFKSLNKNTIEHDLKANDVRIALNQLGCFNNWVSAHYLKQSLGPDASPFGKSLDTLPDWLCSARSWNKRKTLALELELSWKGVKRMRYIFNKYMQKGNLNHLWYVVPSKSFGERLAKTAQEYDLVGRKGNDWFLWSLFDEVIGCPAKARIFTLSGIQKPQNMFLVPAHSSAHRLSTLQNS